MKVCRGGRPRAGAFEDAVRAERAHRSAAILFWCERIEQEHRLPRAAERKEAGQKCWSVGSRESDERAGLAAICEETLAD
jgi:hypothetical protein